MPYVITFVHWLREPDRKFRGTSSTIKVSASIGTSQKFHVRAIRSCALLHTHTTRWEAQYAIPSWLLESLRKQPNCRLFIRLPYGSNTAQAIAKLCGLSQLYSLDVMLANTQYQALAELDRLLSQATSLSSLSIHWCSPAWSQSNRGRCLDEFTVIYFNFVYEQIYHSFKFCK